MSKHLLAPLALNVGSFAQHLLLKIPRRLQSGSLPVRGIHALAGTIAQSNCGWAGSARTLVDQPIEPGHASFLSRRRRDRLAVGPDRLMLRLPSGVLLRRRDGRRRIEPGLAPAAGQGERGNECANDGNFRQHGLGRWHQKSPPEFPEHSRSGFRGETMAKSELGEAWLRPAPWPGP